MTLSKLAKLANVSVSVVSKAFSGREDISEAMREHVFSVAKEYGCFHQFYHVPYDKPVVAVIIPEIISQYYVHYMQCFKEHLEKNGYTMLLSINNFDKHMTEELVRYYTQYSKVNAIICFGDMPKTNVSSDTVLISISPKALECEYAHRVYQCLDTGLEEALLYLKKSGHKRIAYVGEPFTDGKLVKLKALMKKNGLDFDEKYIVCSRFRFEEAGMDGVRKLLGLEENPSVIIGAYGYITKGILSELEDRGISVPDGMSVISLDNEPYPLSLSVDVSCVPSDIENVCSSTIALLNECLENKSVNGIKILEIPASFYEGETVKPI